MKAGGAAVVAERTARKRNEKATDDTHTYTRSGMRALLT